MPRKNNKNAELQELGAHLAKTAPEHPDLEFRESLRAELLSKFGGETKKEEHDLLTVSEVAAFLRVDPATVRRWIKTGALSAVVLPFGGTCKKTYRVRKRDIQSLKGWR